MKEVREENFRGQMSPMAYDFSYICFLFTSKVCNFHEDRIQNLYLMLKVL